MQTKPEIGEIVLTDHSSYNGSPFLITDFGPGENEDQGWPIQGVLFVAGASGFNDRPGMLYPTKDLAAEAEQPGHIVKCWKKPNKLEDLVKDLVTTLSNYM